MERRPQRLHSSTYALLEAPGAVYTNQRVMSRRPAVCTYYERHCLPFGSAVDVLSLSPLHPAALSLPLSPPLTHSLSLSYILILTQSLLSLSLTGSLSLCLTRCLSNYWSLSLVVSLIHCPRSLTQSLSLNSLSFLRGLSHTRCLCHSH
mgnify:CR=1 FL=1